MGRWRWRVADKRCLPPIHHGGDFRARSDCVPNKYIRVSSRTCQIIFKNRKFWLNKLETSIFQIRHFEFNILPKLAEIRQI